MSSLTPFKTLTVFDFDYAYLDSGAPVSSTYTTWVIFHGLGLNGAVFEKILPLAHAHNLRIVSVNRRGYAPSSGFEADEVSGIGFGKTHEEAEPFLRGQGVEIATFLVKFATQEGIPLADLDGPTGGIALIGWSLAGIHALSLLAYLDALSEDTRSALQKYLHTILSHDIAPTPLGIPNAATHNTSFLSMQDDQKRFDALVDWATAHYIHKSVTSENPDDLEFNHPSDTIPRSMRELSYEQRANYTNLDAFLGSDGKLRSCDVTAFAKLTKRALFNKSLAEKLPNVRVRYMSSGTSPGMVVWALWMLRKHAANPKEHYGDDAEKARDIKFVFQTEGNHFIFWDDPQKAIQQYGHAIML
ncbi:hypothetical protein JVU11DRAFT_98 [Chiua virens]|nr:hypothetical protein JVU11DRAFT_98 [Chiua virens]